MVNYNLIVAMCRNNGIGFKNKIPSETKRPPSVAFVVCAVTSFNTIYVVL